MKGDTGTDIFLVPRVAKSLLRVRRWGIKSVWGEEQEEESESRENNAESARAAQRVRACQASCWSNWSQYTGCSVPCGSSGRHTRTRHVALPAHCAGVSCPGHASETAPCGQSCYNGGTLRATDCACPPAYTGTCCGQGELNHLLVCVKKKQLFLC